MSLAQYSGAVKLAEVSDFLSPSQACILPLIQTKQEQGSDDQSDVAGSSAAAAGGGRRARVALQLEPDLQKPTKFNQIRLDSVKKTATITLNDCLACSGCVTSAETVLITSQSSEEFLRVLALHRAHLRSAGSDQEQPSKRPKLEHAGAQPQEQLQEERLEPEEEEQAESGPPPELVVVSLSPQSRVALAEHFGLGPAELQLRLGALLREEGVGYLLDTSQALDISLLEAQREFVARFRRHKDRKPAARKRVTIGAELEDVPAPAAPKTAEPQEPGTGPLPVLVAECPGWVCYAEKTQGDFVLPYMSSVKSPQQVLGTVVKRLLPERLQVRPDQVYHMCVMPCFDKKLEASRDDHFNAEAATRDVDCVLSTAELLSVLQDWAWARHRSGGSGVSKPEAEEQKQLDTASAVAAETADGGEPDTELKDRLAGELLRGLSLPEHPELDHFFTPLRAVAETLNDPGLKAAAGIRQDQVYRPPDVGASGGYCENVFRYAAQELFGVRLDPEQPLTYTPKRRNPDFRELELRVEGQVVLRFALAYGFRNIQNLVRQIKTGSCPYDYVEVMACPSGCLNGGGQLRATGLAQQRQLLQKLDELYLSQPRRAPSESPLVPAFYQVFVGQDEVARAQLLHTQYHYVPPMELENPMGIKW